VTIAFPASHTPTDEWIEHVSQQIKEREAVEGELYPSGPPESTCPQLWGWAALRAHPRFDVAALGALVALLAP
jgi:hypothetical protein